MLNHLQIKKADRNDQKADNNENRKDKNPG